MLIEINAIELDYMLNALAYQEARLWDVVGDFNKMNQKGLAAETQKEADIIHQLRTNIERQKLDTIDF